MEERSPVEILGAILDEVEGYRRTDSKSYLPVALIQEARAVFDIPPSSGLGASNSASPLTDVGDLEGRTISHVFDSNLKRGEILIACSDGAFLALQAEPDGEESYITTCGAYSGKCLADYLHPADLVIMGVMTKEQAKAAEHEAAVKKARANAERLELQATAARRALEKISASAP